MFSLSPWSYIYIFSLPLADEFDRVLSLHCGLEIES